MAEKGDQPSIILYAYPSLEVARVLKKGTNAYFTDVEFSSTGTKLGQSSGTRVVKSIRPFPDEDHFSIADISQDICPILLKPASFEGREADFERCRFEQNRANVLGDIGD